jgi:hypothetical protein
LEKFGKQVPKFLFKAKKYRKMCSKILFKGENRILGIENKRGGEKRNFRLSGSNSPIAISSPLLAAWACSAGRSNCLFLPSPL